MKRIILLVAGVMLSLTIYAQNEKVDWNVDLDYLAKELSEKHYNFFTVKSKDDFLSGINAIKQDIKNLNDFQIALKTQQLIASFGDAHTMLNFFRLLDENRILPIHVFWASDGLFIVQTTQENKEILGSQLLSINQIPITTIIDSLSTLFTVDNRAIVKIIIPMIISSVQILEYFGFSDSTQIELGLKTKTNQNQTYILKPSVINQNNKVSFEPDTQAFDIKNKDVYFTDFYFANEKIYYMLYNVCWSKELELKHRGEENAKTMPSFKVFEENALNTLKHQPVDKIIFDLRHNSGGSSPQGTAFVEKLAKFLEKNPNIKTYVVIGSATFSSAILNALDFKKLTTAVFVGEETAGKPNHFGEVTSFRLPNSNLSINYSTKYFKNTDENVNTITPDVKIEMSFSDFTKGVDPVFEWIKQQ